MIHFTKVPISVRILLTKKCNLRCNFCLADAGNAETENELETSEWLRFFERLRELQVFSITLSGGEVFLRKDIFELLTKLRGNRLHKIVILTNGTLITKEIAKRLNQLNIRSLAISIDGSEERHDQIRGKGSFKKSIEGIHNLLKFGIIPQILFTPIRNNYDNLGELIDFLTILGIRDIQVNTLDPKGRCFDIYKDIVLEYPNQVKEFLEVIDKKREEYSNCKINCEFGFYYHLPETYNYYLKNPENFKMKHLKDGCSAASTSCTITPTGDVIPCEGFPTFIGGNIRNQNLLDIWTNSPKFQIIRDLAKFSMDQVPKCKDCKYIYLCDAGCRANAYLIYNDLLGPDILCPYWDNPLIYKKNEEEKNEE